MSHSYRDLLVWQKSMALVKMVYQKTRSFPNEEMFGLTLQMRRAAVSVPCNVAEGQGRATKKDFRQFLAISRGSLLELETQFLIAEELGFLSAERRERLFLKTDELLRMLNGLMKSMD
ncbi:MAG TPA: four helix bundle protein [Candidatus Bathyarchaeia archaeon]|nr:four helix bundle protein [Candidatus Bathyarchaeia archaeon]